MDPFCMAFLDSYGLARCEIGAGTPYLALLLPALLLARFMCAFDWFLALIHSFSLGLP